MMEAKFNQLLLVEEDDRYFRYHTHLVHLGKSPLQQRGWKWSCGVTLGISVVLFMIFVVLFPRRGDLWADDDFWRCDEYCENSHLCESVPLGERPGIMQPGNTWSNMAYLVFARHAWAFALSDYSNGNEALRILSFVFAGVSSPFAGLGSWLFHATISGLGHQLDVASIAVVMYTLCAMALTMVFPKHLNSKPAAGVLVVGIIVAAILGRLNATAPIAISGVALLFLVPLIGWRAGRFWQAALDGSVALVELLVAINIRAMGLSRAICDPEALVSPHFVWHVLTGLALHRACAALLGTIERPKKVEDEGRDEVDGEAVAIAVAVQEGDANVENGS